MPRSTPRISRLRADGERAAQARHAARGRCVPALLSAVPGRIEDLDIRRIFQPSADCGDRFAAGGARAGRAHRAHASERPLHVRGSDARGPACGAEVVDSHGPIMRP